MKKLIVAEKPSVGRDIARVLGVDRRGEGFLYGDGYVVTWAVGHLVTLREPGEVNERWTRWRMEDLPMLPEDIPLKVIPQTRGQYEVIRKLMLSDKIDSLICATDSAREGELIFRYIYRMTGCTKPVERLWISSMTDAAIRQGFAELKPAAEYDALYESARCRSEADWLVGMNASRAFSLRYDAHLSVGRVQTPTLSLIVRRDREIAAFVPEEYWEVRADFGDYEGLWINPAAPKEGRDGEKLPDTRVYDRQTAESVRAAVKGRDAVVEESVTERKRFQPPQLFDLTSLQREANRKFGFPAEKTLKLAQALYETRKALTYPRTDSRYLPDDMKPKVARVLKGLPEPYAAMVADPAFREGVSGKRWYDNSKISDHHAIVPTEKRVDPAQLTEDERKIYDMVVRRLIAMHYPDYLFDSARVITRVDGHRFRSSGTMPVEEGWRAVYDDGGNRDGKEPPLPVLKQGDGRRVEKVSVRSAKTKPPKAHTDASILSLMENAGRDIEDETLRERMKSSGLGTPATRAAIIERLIEVGYARRAGKTIVSTEKGQKLIDAVPEQIASAVTTGKWEKALSEMAGYQDEAERSARSARFMSGIRRFSVFLVDAARSAPGEIRFEREAPKTRKRAPASGTEKGKARKGRQKS
ncbi:MAG: DNA topoisomerase 3 [Clostridia bacterium]|nr:DNA topoisomerase 3 [Clostridia bacterium]